VAKKKSAALPLEPLRDLLAWWKQARVRGMIIGGLAVSLLGRPRTTRDVDAVILLVFNLLLVCNLLRDKARNLNRVPSTNGKRNNKRRH
jgi:hypothetical protein